ncbi:MAG TPA: hypothetical protein PLG89_10175 [Arenimonas sp.]|nr:hypothetical protein [Arenimonas sp.]
MTEASAQVHGPVRQAQQDSRVAAVASAARSVAQRQQGVVVAGTTMVGSNRMVIVKLGQASLGEARASICRQAAASFKQPLAGERLRVQRHRGAQPAVDVGSITCD